MNKISVVVFSLFFVSCGSKKNLNNTNVNDMIAISPEKKTEKVKNKEDLFGYWKKIKASASNKISQNNLEDTLLFYKISEDYLKRCELSKDAHFIISNEEHKLEWLGNEEFHYTKDNKKIEYSIFKFDNKIKSMSFSENSSKIDLIKLQPSDIKENYEEIKDKCKF